ncbi:MAG TPA: hypothetical protein VLI39_17345 [Sedimentisphaerales bacterium]|nr:hypothetical protein [Sedimentisphaerales bacterium]
MNGRIEIALWTALLGGMLSLGCASRQAASGPAQILCPNGVTTAQIVVAAHDVLAKMHFPIEKLDVEQGLVRTRPLRGAQFFEFWRSDNVGGFNTVEANLQSIRRIVEVRVKALERGSLETAPESGGYRLECTVETQRLALPGNEVAGVSQAYLIHTRSESTQQTFEVTPQQKAQMAWIDLGSDPELAAEIVKRIEKALRD